MLMLLKELLLKSDTSQVSYPLLNVYILHKKFANSNSNVLLSITIESICAVDLIVSNEYKTFVSNLEMNGIRSHYL